MKKTRWIFMIAFVAIFLSSACAVQEVTDLKRELNAKVSPNLVTSKQEALQQLSELVQIISDDTQEHSTREKANGDFIELLASTLSTYVLSDQELSNLQLNVIQCKNQKSIQNDLSARFIVFMSYPEIFGTLERTWTLAEIYKGNEKHVQLVYERTSEVPTNCKMIQEDGRDYVLLYGGTTVHTPRPIFVSCWELSGTELLPSELMNRTDITDSADSANVQNYVNTFIFEGGQEQWVFNDEMTDIVEKPLLSVKLGSKAEIIIFYENGKFVAQKQ